MRAYRTEMEWLAWTGATASEQDGMERKRHRFFDSYCTCFSYHFGILLCSSLFKDQQILGGNQVSKGGGGQKPPLEIHPDIKRAFMKNPA